MLNNNLYRKEIQLDELKSLQMDVLSAMDKYCKDNNIRYSIACGTLLGAIRHKGYIPWDDDIDIYIPREDYNRLVLGFPKLYAGRYKLSSLERDPYWKKPYAKAFDDKTVMVECAKEKTNLGVNIDVFPIDDVPDNPSAWNKYDRMRRCQQNLFALKFVKISKKRSILKNVALFFFRICTFFYSTRRWALRLNNLAQKHNGKGYSSCFECCQGIHIQTPFPKSLFDNIIEVPFENRYFKAFADSDTYLFDSFGDYMQLPPIEKRVTHHAFKAYWK